MICFALRRKVYRVKWNVKVIRVCKVCEVCKVWMVFQKQNERVNTCCFVKRFLLFFYRYMEDNIIL